MSNEREKEMRKAIDSMPIEAVYGCTQLVLSIFAGVEFENDAEELKAIRSEADRLGKEIFGSPC